MPGAAGTIHETALISDAGDATFSVTRRASASSCPTLVPSSVLLLLLLLLMLLLLLLHLQLVLLRPFTRHLTYTLTLLRWDCSQS